MESAHIPVPVFESPSDDEVRAKILLNHKPAILRNFHIGSCRQKWTKEYLTESIGADKFVSVHESSENRLRFVDKNFVYRVYAFGDFMEKVDDSSPDKKFYYYRAIADDARKEASDFRRDFPKLSDDFVIPKFVEPEKNFSCVLRIASPDLGLWLHFDVMDNVLVQVRGKKNAVLFDPEDYEYLYLHGDKSLVHDPNNVNLKQFPLFSKARKWECTMEEGDILFIPAFWMHYMVSQEFSIAVNVFWYNLPRELYDTKDTYGNKDLLPFSRAAQGLDRALKQMDCLPSEYKRFYARMLKSKIDKFLSVS